MKRCLAVVAAWLVAVAPLRGWVDAAGATAPDAPMAAGQIKRSTTASQISFLSFDELVQLSNTDELSPELQGKLDTLLQTPLLSSGIAEADLHAKRPVDKKIGPVLRVAFWNIERGLQLDLMKQALTDPKGFEQTVDEGKKRKESEKAAILQQAETLRDADVLILNEVDLGMKRTDYRDVAQEMAAALGMNYTYGVEFLEVDALEDLGTESSHLEDPELAKKMDEDLKPDPAKYRGLHGNAILSRYPISDARIYKLPVCHDWYADEKKEISQLEKGKRLAANALFLERINREVRRGNRMALAADIRVPESPTGTMTIVNAHLENKCKPDCRRKQMQAIYEEIKDVKNPVVIAGDMNTTGKDGSPMSVRGELIRLVKDYQFWLKNAITWFTPVSLPTYALMPFKFWRTYRDPTVAHIPVLGSNAEAGLFSDVKKFKFADGNTFDTRGLPTHTASGRSGTFGNTNERAKKGFASTFAMPRDFGGVLKLKLDWFFIKPLEQPARDAVPGKKSRPQHLFEPYYPVAMQSLNDSVDDRLSDHCPMTVDIPLTTVHPHTPAKKSARP